MWLPQMKGPKSNADLVLLDSYLALVAEVEDAKGDPALAEWGEDELSTAIFSSLFQCLADLVIWRLHPVLTSLPDII